MKDVALFHTPDGQSLTTAGLAAALEKVGAAGADTVYMHTAMNFGAPDPRLSRQDLLGLMLEAILSTGIRNLLVPVFTFSFCNGQDYDVQTSRSRMGALNEHIRKLPNAIRSVDPLMSSALIGEARDLVENLGKHSIGEDSTFDRLHRRGGARFLFLGASMSECFTYSHYVEERLGVPYRYDRNFTGRITDNGRTWEDTYALFVRYRGVVVSTEGKLEKDLLRRGLLHKQPFGAAEIACASEAESYALIAEHLRENVYCYTVEDPRDRNTAFEAHNMVAL
jgi:aminoglycoside 3-N-acetyltransferase